MHYKSCLTIVQRCLAALDRLEDQGASVNVLRADLSTVPDRLESAIQADALDRRRKALTVAGETRTDYDDGSLTVNL